MLIFLYYILYFDIFLYYPKFINVMKSYPSQIMCNARKARSHTCRRTNPRDIHHW